MHLVSFSEPQTKHIQFSYINDEDTDGVKQQFEGAKQVPSGEPQEAVVQGV